MVKQLRAGTVPANDDVLLQYTIGSKSLSTVTGTVSSTGKTVSVDVGYSSNRLDADAIFSGESETRGSTTFELYSKVGYQAMWSSYNSFEDIPDLSEPTHQLLKQRAEVPSTAVESWFESTSKEYLPIATASIDTNYTGRDEIELFVDSAGNIYSQLIRSEPDKLSHGRDIDVLRDIEFESFVSPCDYDWFAEYISPALL